MKNRRSFLKTAATIGLLSPLQASAKPPAGINPSPADLRPDSDRRFWLQVLNRIAEPVLHHLAQRELRIRMPVESRGELASRRDCTHLEAFARTLVGLAPWLELRDTRGEEARLQARFRGLARECLDAATDPASPDFLNFSQGSQPLVDAAFLAQAILRAPATLWKDLDTRVKRHVLNALASSRSIRPPNNNWLLFSALVEAALLQGGEPTFEDRLEAHLRTMLGWYVGDGLYGDGPRFHFDYYNSFVIHPALVDIMTLLHARDPRFESSLRLVMERARRHAEIQERLIAPDGSFPAVGRSLAYRFGAFQALVQMALHHELPVGVKAAQVRSALTMTIRRMMNAPGTFDAQGWLQVGFCGHQPALGEPYISTGSLYLCTTVLLPLGLPETDSFWSQPSAPWTAKRIWSGEPMPPDHALADRNPDPLPTLNRGR